MASTNDLKKQIYSCECDRCKALVCLVEQCGAQLLFSPTRAGRLCELAVVAAAGDVGLSWDSVVNERRAYADHLRIALSGPTSDADEPVHIEWATYNSNHNPDAIERINLGQARASIGIPQRK